MNNVSQVFTTAEFINALKATKAGKAAGPDTIFVDMLTNMNENDPKSAAIRWLHAFYDDVMTTAMIQNMEISKCDSDPET